MVDNTETDTDDKSIENEQNSEAEEKGTNKGFVIKWGEMGEYGFENTLNAGTDLEETKIVYHIPAGTYTVKNLGSNASQINAYSDETHKTDEGWEEPAKMGDGALIEPGETIDFTIEDGYYVEMNIDGELEFTAK